MKRLLSVVLALVMVFAVIPLGTVTVSAETLRGTTGDCIWTLVEGVLTVSGNGEMGDYEGKPYDNECQSAPCVAPWGSDITEVIIEEGVTGIGVRAFQGCYKLKKVKIAESVTRIGRLAFLECGIYNDYGNTWNGDSDVLYIDNCLIESYTWDEVYQIKEGTRLIADYAFCYSFDPVEIIIPDSVKYIGEGAFLWGKKLERIVIPHSITEIRDYTFKDCRELLTVEFSNSVTSIGKDAFSGCSHLRTVVYSGKGVDRLSLLGDYSYDLRNVKWICSVKEELKAHTDGKYYYCVDDVENAYNGLTFIGNEVYYIKNGIWQNDVTTLIAYNGKGYYIEDGKWSQDTTLVKYNGGYSYVENGIWINTTTLVKYKDKWFYVKNGKWCKDNILFKYKDKWFYIENYKWDSSATKFFKYRGKTFYIKKGKWESSITTLVNYKNKWRYVKNGKWNKSKAIVRYNDEQFYVNNGYVQFGYLGRVKYNDKTYKIKKGKVV